VTSIGTRAFENCSRLTSITIPDSVTSIGKNAFKGTKWLEEYPDDMVIINGIIYKYKGKKRNIAIPDGVTSIGDSAFDGCSRLTSITIPDGVTSIGDSAFEVCSRLTSITIPDSVTSIGDSAFDGCSRLTSITIPDSVTSIGNNAFCWCESLTSITIPDSVTSIGNYAFACCSNLTSITIPDSVTSIGYCAFKGCSSLTSITIPNSVTSIGNYGSSLTNLVLKNKGGFKINVKEIEDADESLIDAINMLFTKEFARKFSHKVKFKLIMDYFFDTADEDAKAYIKKNFTKIMKQTIENGDIERINQLLEKTDFVTKRNIDKFIEYAIEKEQHEIYLILLNYKNEKIGFKTVEEQFKL
jgi:hypothetical protein